MALTGLQIQKLLPKTNCKECGSNTCLAFAMKLAAKKAELSQCPYASEEAKNILGAASEPPVKCIELGAEKSLKVGGETVLYRHEKTFVHQTAFAVNVNDVDSPEVIDKTLSSVREYILERVGERLQIDMVSVTQKGNNAGAFARLCKQASEVTGRPIVVRSPDTSALVSAAEAVSGSHSVLAFATGKTAHDLVEAARKFGHALAVAAPDLNSLTQLTTSIRDKGFNDLVLCFQTHSLAEKFQTNSIARRAALRDNYKPLGYPTLTFLGNDNMLDDTALAVNEISKYGGICVFPSFDTAQLSSLMTLRLNIFTDPQKPIQVEPKLYEIGEPEPNSPLFLTTDRKSVV